MAHPCNFPFTLWRLVSLDICPGFGHVFPNAGNAASEFCQTKHMLSQLSLSFSTIIYPHNQFLYPSQVHFEVVSLFLLYSSRIITHAAQCDSIHITWNRGAAIGYEVFLSVYCTSWSSLRPNPTAPYFLQIYTSYVSTYSLVFIHISFQVFRFSFHNRGRIGIEFRTST
jgi:hypothetical protein